MNAWIEFEKDSSLMKVAEVITMLKLSGLCSDSLTHLAGMAGSLVCGVLGAPTRAGIVNIISSRDAHPEHVQAVADALVNHCIPLWDEVRDALRDRLDTQDKYMFMSMLTPLLFDASSLEDGLNAYQYVIPLHFTDLANKLVGKIKSAGR